MTEREAVAGIVVYEPDHAELARLVARVAPDVAEVIVFANSPFGEAAEQALRRAGRSGAVTIVRPDANVGLGAAYDAFVEAARARGATYLLILDQDSLPAEGAVRRLAGTHARLRSAGEHPAIVGPRPVGPDGVPMKVPRRRTPSPDRDAIPVDFVISSGSLVDLDAARTVGRFREDFFIDAIDIEWCMRATALGYSIWVDDALRMDHRLGRGVIRLPAGIHLADQPPRRLYTFIRNQLAMMRLSHVPVAHKVKMGATLPARIAIHLARNGFSRACRAAVLNGVRDGIANRLGPPEDALAPPFRRRTARARRT